jgi:hypothetical protein
MHQVGFHIDISTTETESPNNAIAFGRRVSVFKSKTLINPDAIRKYHLSPQALCQRRAGQLPRLQNAQVRRFQADLICWTIRAASKTRSLDPRPDFRKILS